MVQRSMIGLPSGQWYRVLERHPDPAALANDGYPLPGYVWLDVAGCAMHRLESELEIRHSDPQCDG